MQNICRWICDVLFQPDRFQGVLFIQGWHPALWNRHISCWHHNGDLFQNEGKLVGNPQVAWRKFVVWKAIQTAQISSVLAEILQQSKRILVQSATDVIESKKVSLTSWWTARPEVALLEQLTATKFTYQNDHHQRSIQNKMASGDWLRSSN